MVVRLALGTAYPFDETRIHGGVEAVAYNLAAALAATGDIDVHVVSLSERCPADAVERRGGLTIHWLRSRPGLGTLKALTIHARRVGGAYREISPDIIHAQGFSAYAFEVPVATPLVLTVHGLEWFVPEMRAAQRYTGPLGAYRKLAEGLLIRRCLRKASAIVGMSGPFVPETIGPMLQGKRIRGIPNPLVLDRWLAVSPESDDGHTILCVGVVERRKDPLTLVRAFRKVANACPDSRLVFVGPILEKEYHSALLDEVSLARLQGRVEFLGLVEENLLIRLCGNAAVVASASPVETAPMALAEAMAAGRAVVAVGAGAISTMIEDGVSGFVVPAEDVDAISERLCQLLDDESLRRRLGSAARSRAQGMFGSTRIAEQTLAVYGELLSARQATRTA